MTEQKPDVLFHHFRSIGSKNYLLYVCKLVEKGFKQKIQPIYIQTKNQQQAIQLDKLLWTFKQDSFIPHTIVGASGLDSTPVQIGWNENQFHTAAAIVNLSEEIPISYLESKKIHEIIDDDEVKKNKARERWKNYKSEGCHLDVYQIK
ncbi:MAG: DNA polymerase III subunit chi [Gammaproteobacteria bacterium]|jgi:DNA polymerase-3 subunit chi